MLLKPTAGDSFQRKFCTGPTISPFSIRNSPSRVMPVLSSVICSTGRMYQKNADQQPALRRLDHLLHGRGAAVHDQAHGRAALTVGVLPCFCAQKRFVEQVLDDALLHPRDVAGREAVVADRRLPQDGILISLRSVTLSPNTFSPSRVVPRSLPLMKLRPSSAARALKAPSISDRKRAAGRGSRITV